VQKNEFNGWLLVDKPAGMTSADVVRVLKKRYNLAKIGHAGTLDPDATGLIPLALGEATKAIPYLLNARKKYKATFIYGVKTDTDDASGNTVKASSYIPTKNEIMDALEYYSDVTFQIPPKVSAVKIKGKRAYKRFKANENFQLAARNINVFKLSLKCYSKHESIIIFECGKGGYVRSIARDIGDFLGCFGHVKKLSRVMYGPFIISEAVPLSDIINLSSKNLKLHIRAIESGIPNLKNLDCNLKDVMYLENGRAIRCPEKVVLDEGEDVIAKYRGKVVGILFKEGPILKVKRKFNI
jgi:tRNA pseudouridine55 synthase